MRKLAEPGGRPTWVLLFDSGKKEMVHCCYTSRDNTSNLSFKEARPTMWYKYWCLCVLILCLYIWYNKYYCSPSLCSIIMKRFLDYLPLYLYFLLTFLLQSIVIAKGLEEESGIYLIPVERWTCGILPRRTVAKEHHNLDSKRYVLNLSIIQVLYRRSNWYQNNVSVIFFNIYYAFFMSSIGDQVYTDSYWPVYRFLVSRNNRYA